jgi:subtilisin family serine protease
VDVGGVLRGLGRLAGRLFGRPPAHEPDRVLAWVDRTSELEAVASELAQAARAELVAIHQLPAVGGALLVFTTRRDLDDAIEALAADPRVRVAQRDYAYALADDASAAPLAWSDSMLGGAALRSAASGAGVRVALIDAGVDRAHRSLAGARLETADVSGHGEAAEAHGTAVAGVLAANGADGVRGLAPRAQLFAIRACVAREANAMAARCLTSALARGLDLALERRARVINLSVAGPPDALVAALVVVAVRSGALVVAAAGNGGKRGPAAYPAALPEVLAVTAIDARLRLARIATRGDYVDLAAPGVELACLSSGGGRTLATGTSFAAPQVSAAAALLLELDPSLSEAQIRELLLASARDAGARGPDPGFGAGIVDPCAAAARIAPDRVRCSAD